MLQIGDKIQVTLEWSTAYDLIGTIVYIDERPHRDLPYLVLFNGWNGGHGGVIDKGKYRCDKKDKASHWWLSEEQFKLLTTTPRNMIKYELLGVI